MTWKQWSANQWQLLVGPFTVWLYRPPGAGQPWRVRITPLDNATEALCTEERSLGEAQALAVARLRRVCGQTMAALNGKVTG